MGKQSFKGAPKSNWVVGPCQTEEIAKQVLAVAHAYGWKWCSNTPFINYTNWSRYGSLTYYCLVKGTYDGSFTGYTIISPETFLSNNPMPEEKPGEKTRTMRDEVIEVTGHFNQLIDFLKSIEEPIYKPAENFDPSFPSMCFNTFGNWSLATYNKDQTTITDVEFLKKYKAEKTRKPGVKYTLEDWKKESEANRKKAEYWKGKFQASDKTANTVADSLTNVLKTHEQLKLDLETTNKNYKILQTENKILKESNENLRNTNDELLKSSTEAKQELGFAKLKIQDLEKERDELGNGNDLLLKSLETASNDLKIANEELKTVKSHLDLRTKGIQALEEDAKRLTKANYELTEKARNLESQNRRNETEIGLLKSYHEELSQDYEDLLNIQKWTKVVGLVGWIGMILCTAFIMFFKG